MEIDYIPLLSESVDWDSVADTEFEAWDSVSDLIQIGPRSRFSATLAEYYLFGQYAGEVLNGGHSQLVHNSLVRKQDFYLLAEGFSRMAVRVGAPEFAGIASRFLQWIEANPFELHSQTGFEGGRAEELILLDQEFSELDANLSSVLETLLRSAQDEQERRFLESCLERGDAWRGDLYAASAIWIKRSNLIRTVSSEEYRDLVESLKKGIP